MAGYHLSGNQNSGATIFYENNIGGEFIDLRQLVWRKRPIMSLNHILEQVCEAKKPINYQKIIDSQKLHILATDLETLSRHIFPPATCIKELKGQLRASSTIPGVAGEPVEVDGQMYIDASLAEPLPYQAAIDEGYDAVLLLSSRPAGEAAPGSGDAIRKLVTLAVSRQIKIKRREILEALSARKETDEQRLAELRNKTTNPDEPPYVFAIHPPAELPIVKQLEKKSTKIIAGTIAGYLAVKETLGHPKPQSFNISTSFYGNY